MLKTKNLILIIATVAGLVALESWFSKSPPPTDNQAPSTAVSETSHGQSRSDQLQDQPEPNGNETKPSDRGTIVRFASQAAIDEFLAQNGFTSAVLTPTSAAAYTVERPLAELKLPAGTEAFPNREYKATATPNDPQYS